MDKENTELIEYLDKKFSSTASKEDIELLRGAVLKVDDRIDGVEKSFDELRGDFRRLQDGIDSYAKRAEAYFQEMVMLAHKVDRHEKWLRQVAEKVGIKLDS